MSGGNITINPVLATNFPGTFSVQSDGYVQGAYMDDPAVRYALTGGVVNSTETLPMWGGVGVYLDIPSPGSLTAPSAVLGSPVGRATAVANLLGFTVFNQAGNMVTSPQSRVPLAAPGMGVNLFLFGSGARIPVACDPALASLEGGLINQQVSWDFVGQQLVPYNAAWAQVAITAAVWSAGVVTFTTASAHGISVGSWFSVSGAAPGGYNGDYKALAGTTGTTLVAALAANPGSLTTDGVVLAGGGAIPVKIRDLNIGNSKVVSYSSVTGFANWNNTGSCALIEI